MFLHKSGSKAYNHFSELYKVDKDIDHRCQSWVPDHMPHMFDHAANDILEKEVSKGEIEAILKSFAHDKTLNINKIV